MSPPMLEAVEPALGGRVIPAIALAAHRTDHAVLLERIPKRRAGVRAAAVGVMPQTRGRPAAEPRHGQGVRPEFCRHAGLE